MGVPEPVYNSQKQHPNYFREGEKNQGISRARILTFDLGCFRRDSSSSQISAILRNTLWSRILGKMPASTNLGNSPQNSQKPRKKNPGSRNSLAMLFPKSLPCSCQKLGRDDAASLQRSGPRRSLERAGRDGKHTALRYEERRACKDGCGCLSQC